MKAKLTVERLNGAARVLKCIAHPDRLRIVQALERGGLHVQDLVDDLGLAQAVVSKHLGVLRRGGVVSCETRANFRYYAILNKNVLGVLDCMRRHGQDPK